MEWNEIVMGMFGVLVFFVGLCFSVIAHELGHLIGGFLSGYRFVSFRILHWLWTKDASGKIKVTKGSLLRGILGQCLMEPCEDEEKFRYWLYNAGGGLVNLITGIALAIPFFFVQTVMLRIVLIELGLSAIILGINNLFPMILGGIPNDGRNIREAGKSSDAKHSLYWMLKVNAEMSKGKCLLDFPEDTFSLPNDADMQNYLVFQMALYRAAQIEESGDYVQSYKLLLQLPAEKLPALYSGQMLLSRMFHELVYFRDAQSIQNARNRLEAHDKRFIKLLTMKHPVFMPYHAAKAAFLNNDKQKARELLAEARKLNPSQQNPGQEHSVTLMLDRLEQRLVE